jgi:hypothetical protein
MTFGTPYIYIYRSGTDKDTDDCEYENNDDEDNDNNSGDEDEDAAYNNDENAERVQSIKTTFFWNTYQRQN